MNSRNNPSRSPLRPQRLHRPVILLAAYLVLLPLAVWAQQSQPTPALGPGTFTVAPVNVADYQLETVGVFLDKWPIVRYDFQLLNKSQNYFNQLKPSDIRATFEGNKIDVEEGALRLTHSEPVQALVLIDGSLSMCRRGGGLDRPAGSSRSASPSVQCGKPDSLDKLLASKQALLSFIESLRAGDAVGVYAFDADDYPVSERTSDKDKLIQRINGFSPREDRDEENVKYSDSTDLYGAVGRALTLAQRMHIRNLIVLSDGMQDTPDAREALAKGQDTFESYKREREQAVVESEQKNGVRVFTIAIGNKNSLPRHPDNLDYVDDDTLTKLSNENMGGRHDYIDLPDLGRSAQGSSSSYQELLEQKLKSTFEVIRQSISYGYSLELRLKDFPHDGKEHTLEMIFTAPGEGNFPAVRVPLLWKEGQTAPQPGKAEVFAAVFLPTPKASVMPANLGVIYAASLGGLGVLALLPVVFLWAQRARHEKAQARALNTSVVKVKRGSEYVDRECPNCPGEPIQPGESIVVCPNPECRRVHHLACWMYVNSRCMMRYCHTDLPIPESVLRLHGIQTA